MLTHGREAEAAYAELRARAACRRQGTRSAPRRGGSSGLSLPLSSLAFTRAGAKFVLISAPTTGAVGFMQQAASGAPALENRGDGAGTLWLLETSITNALFNSRDLSGATWASGGAPTITGNAGPGTDGGTTATRVQGGTTDFRTQSRASGAALGNPSVMSAWLRRFSTGGDIAGQFSAGTLVPYHDASATTTYERLFAVANSSGAAEANIIIDGRPFTTAQDALADFAQLEVGRYPHSAVATAGAGVTVPADSLTGTAPAWMLASAWSIPQVSPIFSNADLVSGDIRWLATFGSASDGLRISHNGTDVRVRAFAAGVEKATSAALTFGKHALLGAVRVDPGAGLVYVNGVAGPAGTAWTWPAGNLRIGGISGGSGNEADARVAQTWSAG